jgi:uncharacterized membrane protein
VCQTSSSTAIRCRTVSRGDHSPAPGGSGGAVRALAASAGGSPASRSRTAAGSDGGVAGRSGMAPFSDQAAADAILDRQVRREVGMSVVYNQIANRSIERIGALSDGLFAIAMTLIVLEIRVPPLGAGTTDAQLASALGDLAPRFVTYLLSFLTLGIFWNGQQTQLSYVDRGNRDLAWLELLFLAIIALFPFTTSLLADHIDLRLALALYWLNIFLAGAALYVIWEYVERTGLTREGTAPAVGVAIRRRIGIAQLLYFIGLVIALLIGTYPAIAWIVLVQLNYAIAPRIGFLHKL